MCPYCIKGNKSEALPLAVLLLLANPELSSLLISLCLSSSPVSNLLHKSEPVPA